MTIPTRCSSPLWLRLAWLLLLAAPALWIAGLIFHYGVDLPDFDEWDAICPLFLKFQAGTLRATDFFAFHNEHRVAFPRLLSFGLGLLTHWNIRAELFLIWCLAGLCSFNLWQLSRATGWLNSRAGPWLFVVANTLLFTPTQFETWLLGIEVAFLVPLTCVTASLWISLAARPAVGFICTMVLATISTFSLASGFLCWVLAFPLLLFRDGRPAWRGRCGWWTIWLTAFIASIALYFHGYQKPPQHPNEMTFFRNPLAALEYLLIYLGGDFALGGSVATYAGGILLCAFTASAIFLWKWRHDRQLLTRTVPWMLLCCLAIASAAITTVGRLGFGIQQALSSRYILFSIMLPIGLLFVIPPLLSKACTQSASAKTRPTLFGALLAIAGGFALLHGLNSVAYLEDWSFTQHHRLIGKAALSFINVVEKKTPLEHFVYDNLPLLETRANALSQLGDLRPPLLHSASIREIADPGTGASPASGALEHCERTPSGAWAITGWAILPEAMRPADAVLFTYDDRDGNPIVFDFATTAIPRPDVAAATHVAAYLRSGWKQTLDIQRLPPGTTTLKVWSYDAERGRASQEKGEAVLTR